MHVLGGGHQPRRDVPCSETMVEEIVAAKRWFYLECYLQSYMPEMQDKNTIMEHAGVFIQCRKVQLLHILKEDGPTKALAFLESDILPLGAANSDFVNPNSIYEQIHYMSDCLQLKRELDITGAMDAVKDYLRFHWPQRIGFCQENLQSPAWRFMAKVDDGSSKGVVQARCLLCQKILGKQSRIRGIVKDHIGRRRCKCLTRYAIDLYKSTIGDMESSETHQTQGTPKRGFDDIVDSGRGKAIRVDGDSQLKDFGRVDGDSQLKDIHKDIDDVITMVADLCIVSSKETKSILQGRINETLLNMRTKVTQFAESSESYGQRSSRMLPVVRSSEHSAQAPEFHAPAPFVTGWSSQGLSIPSNTGSSSTIIAAAYNTERHSLLSQLAFHNSSGTGAWPQGFAGVTFHSGSSTTMSPGVQSSTPSPQPSLFPYAALDNSGVASQLQPLSAETSVHATTSLNNESVPGPGNPSASN